MLKKRIGAALLVNNGIVVQSLGFRNYLPVGKPLVALEFLSAWEVDEIILLDISATRTGQCVDAHMIAQSSQRCFVPLAVGGGIQSIDDMDRLLKSGADKIVLNHVLFKNKTLLAEAARKYGNQCILACIDVMRDAQGHYRVYDYVTRQTTSIGLADWMHQLELEGAGEIIIHDVARDGSLNGFDTELLTFACDQTNVPVIALGGAGGPDHFLDVFTQTDVSAACAGNYFHFSEHSVLALKGYLSQKNLDIRHQSSTGYLDNRINEKNRLQKKDDAILEKLLYTVIEKEQI